MNLIGWTRLTGPDWLDSFGRADWNEIRSYLGGRFEIPLIHMAINGESIVPRQPLRPLPQSWRAPVRRAKHTLPDGGSSAEVEQCPVTAIPYGRRGHFV